MVARKYADLGGFSGEAENGHVEYSSRGIDRDRIQTLTVECDPLDPFSGTVHIQGTVEEPLEGRINTGRTGQIRPDASDLVWFDLIEMDITAEGGTFFVQMEIEISQIRAVVKVGNFVGGRIKSIHTMI